MTVALATPALVLDLDILERNLAAMDDRARRLGVTLRPHVKTHKCVEIARRQTALPGAGGGITVSTLHEARVFAEHGFRDILWAVPVNPHRVEDVAALARQITLRVLVDSDPAVSALERCGQPLHVSLKVDTGYHRAGVDPDDPGTLVLARRIHETPHLSFAGLVSHAGHAYRAGSRTEIAAIAEADRARMTSLARRLTATGIPVPEVSVGSTPTMQVVEDLAGVTEVRPGNYALFDWTQVHLGSCSVEDCALSVLATVISSPAGSDHSIVDAGALALSRDPGPSAGGPGFGRVFVDPAAGGGLAPEVRLTGLSQEHGRVNARYPVGTRIRILPNHACLTVAQFDTLHVLRGPEVVDHWTVWRGRD